MRDSVFNKAVEELGIVALTEVRNLVNQCICEEMGISDIVGKSTKELCSLIIQDLKNASWEPVVDRDENVYEGVKSCYLSLAYNFNGNDIDVGVECYNFYDNARRKQYGELFPDVFFEEARSSYGYVTLPMSNRKTKMKFISLRLLLVSGTPDYKQLSKSARHELRHIYEQMCNNERNFGERKDNALYGKSADFYNRAGDDKVRSDVGFLGYMSFDYERHAFIEEYFEELEQGILKAASNDEDCTKFIYSLDNDNEVMRKIVRMRRILTKLQKGDVEYVQAAEEMLEGTGFTFGKFMVRAEAAIKDMSMRYGKCVIKMKNDYPSLYNFDKYRTLTYIQNRDKPYAEWYI